MNLVLGANYELQYKGLDWTSIWWVWRWNVWTQTQINQWPGNGTQVSSCCLPPIVVKCRTSPEFSNQSERAERTEGIITQLPPHARSRLGPLVRIAEAGRTMSLQNGSENHHPHPEEEKEKEEQRQQQSGACHYILAKLLCIWFDLMMIRPKALL